MSCCHVVSEVQTDALLATLGKEGGPTSFFRVMPPYLFRSEGERVRMYVCMYVCMYVYMYVYIHRSEYPNPYYCLRPVWNICIATQLLLCCLPLVTLMLIYQSSVVVRSIHAYIHALLCRNTHAHMHRHTERSKGINIVA